MKFLAKHKEMVKYQMSDARQSPGGNKTQTKTCFVTGVTAQVKHKTPGSESEPLIKQPLLLSLCSSLVLHVMMVLPMLTPSLTL